MNSHDLLRNVIIYLGAAIVAVPITQKLGLGSILGYLISGLVIGPAGLGLITSTEEVMHFSEFGVVILLFMIGLELNPRRLWQMRKPIFGLGGLQVVLSVAFITPLIAFFMGDLKVGIVGAMGFAMSSTAMALQLLRERHLHAAAVGQGAFAVLLFQDLAVIPMLAMLPWLASQGGAAQQETMTGALPFLKGGGAIVAIVVGGRYLIRPAFRIIAGTHLREIFTAFALVLVLGIAALMQAVGLSMALGAFLAGVLLAESEYRHELEIDLEPFKGLLLGLFFIAVGMSMQLSAFVAAPGTVMGLVVSAVALKIAILALLSRFFGYNSDEQSIFSLALSQGGEFAFVLFGVAGQLGALTAEQSAILNITIALSMLATPFLFIAYERWIQPRRRKKNGPKRAFDVQNEGNPVILAGFGRVGQVIGRMMHAQGVGLTILEQDPSQVDVVRKFGWKTFYGDVSRIDLLEAAGAAEAKLLILAIDDMDASWRTIDLVQEKFPHLKILVRAEDRIEAYRFHNRGIPSVRSTLGPGLEMAEEAMKILGSPAFEAHLKTQRFRRYDRKQFEKSAKHIDDERTLISMSQESRSELERMMKTDERRRGGVVTEGWG